MGPDVVRGAEQVLGSGPGIFFESNPCRRGFSDHETQRRQLGPCPPGRRRNRHAKRRKGRRRPAQVGGTTRARAMGHAGGGAACELMFASKSLVEHVVRGVVGLAAFAFAAMVAPAHPLLALAAVPLALVALRGCPMCWTIGLAQTVAAKLRGASRTDTCVDGRCAVVAVRRVSNAEREPGHPLRHEAPVQPRAVGSRGRLPGLR
jgi:hypothetical protein